MARIAGVDIPRDKPVFIALTYIYGIGRTRANQIVARTNIEPTKRVRELTEDEVGRIRELIDHEFTVEGDLRREVNLNIKRLMEIGSYRGLRHRRGVGGGGRPTRPDARTRRGPRRTVAGRKKAAAMK